MRYDWINYGPHGSYGYYTFYYYNESSLQYGMVLDDSNDSLGWGICFEKTATVSSIGFYTVEYTGTPDYALGIVTVSGTTGDKLDPHPNADPARLGNYEEELYSNAQWQAYEPDVLGSGWNWYNLATQVSATKGDHAAIVIIPSGAVVPDTNNKAEINVEATYRTPFPGLWTYVNSWSHQDWNSPMAIKYTDGSTQGLALVGLPWALFNSPKEWGVEFTLPFQATALGATFNLYPYDSDPQDAPFKVILADSSDNELASRTIPDFDLVNNTSNNNTTVMWDTDTDPVLDAETVYRLYLKPTSSEDLDKKGLTLASEADKANLFGGTGWKWIERDSPASGWTYQPTQYPWLSIVITDITSAGSGSGTGSAGGAGNSSFGFIS